MFLYTLMSASWIGIKSNEKIVKGEDKDFEGPTKELVDEM